MEHNQKSKQNRLPTGNLHIYEDDVTGNFYYWNGKELVLLGNRKPQIGDQGDADFQRKEQEERRERIKKQREEAEKRKAAGQAYDEAALKDSESAKERQQRIKDIQNMFEDEKIKDDLERESKVKIDKELAKKKAAEMRKVKNSAVQRLNVSLRAFLNNELQKQREYTWMKPNMSYEGTGIMRRGIRRKDNEAIPRINVYFDQSGSWHEEDIKVGMEAIGVLKNYEDRHEIKVNLFYFSDHIYDDAAEARAGGSTSAGAELIYHIQSTHPDNVIIMTDGDIGGSWTEIYEAPKIRLNGALWFLFKNEPSPALPKWIKANKGQQQFML